MSRVTIVGCGKIRIMKTTENGNLEILKQNDHSISRKESPRFNIETRRISFMIIWMPWIIEYWWSFGDRLLDNGWNPTTIADGNHVLFQSDSSYC
ncbi:hypothetical protein GCK72_022336 [Caenorhabditis remanei]|uniref:Uncharacterized protein n=1 Tax=Caenorhabditis remanei TaxID=31234 RepID=A0A6A5FTP4_CAERE|nr:hypothetical protein GCK72_022336 [Caenorhabditis remanei]KAF1745889.1 hypothetical protein GCK72_022336 [Caenorhabditis remanei]